MGFNDITPVLKDFAGEVFVDRLDFLNDHDVGLKRIQPTRKRFDPRLDPIDVERGDLHGTPLGLTWP